MSQIIALLRQAQFAVHERRMKKEVDKIQHTILEDVILFALKLAINIENEECERSNLKLAINIENEECERSNFK